MLQVLVQNWWTRGVNYRREGIEGGEGKEGEELGWTAIPLSPDELPGLVQQLDDGITMTSQESVVTSLPYSTTGLRWLDGEEEVMDRGRDKVWGGGLREGMVWGGGLRGGNGVGGGLRVGDGVGRRAEGGDGVGRRVEGRGW